MRKAVSLQRSYSKGRKTLQALLEVLAAGKLRDTDIVPHNGGIARTILDNVDPVSTDNGLLSVDESESESSPTQVAVSTAM